MCVVVCVVVYVHVCGCVCACVWLRGTGAVKPYLRTVRVSKCACLFKREMNSTCWADWSLSISLPSCALRFIATLHEKDNPTKAQFMKDLPKVLHLLPKRVIHQRVRAVVLCCRGEWYFATEGGRESERRGGDTWTHFALVHTHAHTHTRTQSSKCGHL